MGWVISWASKWEDYSNYLGKRAEISRNWTTTHFLAYHGWPQNCHGAGGCVIWYANVLQRAYIEA